jgi:hypothetical protein
MEEIVRGILGFDVVIADLHEAALASIGGMREWTEADLGR